MRFLAYKNDTHRCLFLFCEHCNESPDKYPLVIEMVRRGEGLTRNLVTGG